jgi:ribosomal protein S18 acetylase RimI-like enzyme
MPLGTDNPSRDTPVRIRQAAPDDAPVVANLLHASFAEYQPLYTPPGFAATTPDAEQVLARMREGPVWVALRHIDVVGTVAAVVNDGSLYIRGMAVRPEARRLRVGARLLDHAERFAIEQGCSRLSLSTTPFLNAAIRLYEKSGFRRVPDGGQDLFGTPLFTMEKYIPR